MTALPTLPMKRVRLGALLPTYGSDDAIGLDLHAVGSFELRPLERRTVPTGFALAFPPGYYGRIAPRSGLAYRHGFDVLAGVIDPDYRGELMVVLINLGDARVVVRDGAKIAQLILERADQLPLKLVDELPVTGRGDGGFGSTGL
jgi:dUTP pyrophosphatase